jgi:hypothetical protein
MLQLRAAGAPLSAIATKRTAQQALLSRHQHAGGGSG